ncbi:MAG TPA: hypothetical protein VFH73_18715, partial [Polyangia bacterium]|nr:hypothetical protein [Polyangia bacterium]
MSSGDPRRGRAVVPFALMAAVSACAQPGAPAPGSAATAVAASRAASAVTAEPPVRLAPVAEARPSLMTSISISSLDRLLGAGTALVGRAVPLPLDPVGVRDMLLSQAGLSPAVGENLDFASPAGAALVSLGPNMEPGLVMAIAAKGVTEAQKVADALGKVVSRRGQAFQIDNGSGGKGWIWISGTVLVLSDSLLALERGAMLALEARRTAPEEVTAVLYPEAIARANGTDVKAGLARMLDKARAGQVAAGQSTEGVELLADLLGYVADASTIEIGLMIDTSRGLAIRSRLNAKPGSGLEKLAREAKPFRLDPSLFAPGGDVALVFASSYGPFIKEQLAKQRRRLETSADKGAPAALKFYDAFVAASTGEAQGAGRARPHLGMSVIYPLKDVATATQLGAEMARMDKAAALAWWNAQAGGQSGGVGLFDWTFKKESVGKLKAFHYSLALNAKIGTPPV